MRVARRGQVTYALWWIAGVICAWVSVFQLMRIGFKNAWPRQRVWILQTLMNHWCPLCGREVTPKTECRWCHGETHD